VKPKKKSSTSELISFFEECYSLMKVKGIREFGFEKGEIKISITRASTAGAGVFGEGITSSRSGTYTPAEEFPREIKRRKEEPAEKKALNTIKSPLSGVFYNAASPNSKPFINPPCNVSKGDTLCIVEAMKVLNEIESPSHCRIITAIAKNAELVKKDDELFEFE